MHFLSECGEHRDHTIRYEHTIFTIITYFPHVKARCVVRFEDSVGACNIVNRLIIRQCWLMASFEILDMFKHIFIKKSKNIGDNLEKNLKKIFFSDLFFYDPTLQSGDIMEKLKNCT